MRHSLDMYLAILCLTVVCSQLTTDPKQAGVETCECQRSGTACEDLLYQQREKLNQQDQLTDELTKLQIKYDNITAILNTSLLHQKQVEETARNDKPENCFRARSLLDNPRLLAVISGSGSITGLAVLDSQLFVVVRTSQQVIVYDTNNMTFTRNITISGSSALRAVIASPRDNCLYISDPGLEIVYRYNLNGNVISNWSVGGKCYGLSLTSTLNVLVTLHFTKQIKEYTPDGSLMREISLDSSIESPFQSVQLPNDQFIVSHGWGNSQHRVCIVNTSGRIIRCYGGSRGSSDELLFTPTSLAIDRHDNMLVADRDNNRVVLMNSSLTHLGNITITSYELKDPRALHLDLLTHRLYIGEDNNAGRVFVLTV